MVESKRVFVRVKVACYSPEIPLAVLQRNRADTPHTHSDTFISTARALCPRGLVLLYLEIWLLQKKKRQCFFYFYV